MTDPARLGAAGTETSRGGIVVQQVIERAEDPVGEVLGEVPLPPYVTAEDVRFAVLAVVVHAPELWPAGPQCRNDGAPYPCRLHRWGRRVLRLRGLSDHEIDDLVALGDPDAPVPGREPSGQ